MLFTNLLVALPLLGGAFSAPTPILNDVLAPVTGIVSPVAGVSNGIGAVQGNSVDVVSIVTNLKDVLTGTIVGANLDVIDDVITTVDTCASVLNNAYTDLGVFTDVTAPVSVHDLINIGKRDAADTPDLDVVSDLVAEVIELVEKLVADLTDEIELDETVNRLLTTLDNNLFILLGSVDQLVPGVLEAVGDLLKDINLDEVLTKVTELLTPLTAGANIL